MAPAHAVQQPPGEMGGWRAYVEARAAAAAGESERAVRGFAAALAARPQETTVAAEALRHAITAGERGLALQAARALEQSESLSPEASLVLLAEDLRTRNWSGAEARIAQIEQSRPFSFTAPIMRAWAALGSRRGDPATILAAANEPLTQSFVPEQLALIQVVQGRREGVDALLALAQDHPRGIRLRVGAAAQLAQRGRRADALRLLEGEAEPLRAARRLIEARRRIPGAIAKPEDGISEFFVRLALELNAQDLRPVALSFARVATFMAPDNSAAAIVAAELLSLEEEHALALQALAQVAPEDPFAGTVRNTRVRLLVAADRHQDALAEARALSAAPEAGVEDWTRLGDIHAELEQFGEAADAYGRAIALLEGGEQAPGAWALWMLRGSALERGGNWREGKAALEQAYRLAPQEPLILNYLGYAQLERRENLEEAERLIREAHRLAPDNASITDSLGWALYVRGNVAEAVPLLERAAAAEPADVVINEHLGDAYYAAGRRLEARFAWRAAAVYAEGMVAERLRAKIERGLTPHTAAP